MLLATPTVVIVAQSGRYLAQIAHQAGYRVWIADCYGDVDTQAIAERWYQLTSVSDSGAVLDAIIALSQGETCQLVYGTGVECFYTVLTALPEHVTPIGNTVETLEYFFQPAVFIAMLRHLALPHPETQLKPPNYSDAPWLHKSCNGFGGQAIYLASDASQSETGYFQRYHAGLPASALFVSDGETGIILSYQQQYIRSSEKFDFTLLGLSHIEGLLKPYQAVLQNMINAVVQYTGLVGFNSLDFILTDDGQLLVLEINPRLSASAQLLADTTPVFDIHLSACLQGELPAELPHLIQHHLHTIFAPNDVVIPTDLVWPDYCADIPPASTIIKENEPICSAIVESSINFNESQQQIETELFKLLF